MTLSGSYPRHNPSPTQSSKYQARQHRAGGATDSHCFESRSNGGREESEMSGQRWLYSLQFCSCCGLPLLLTPHEPLRAADTSNKQTDSPKLPTDQVETTLGVGSTISRKKSLEILNGPPFSLLLGLDLAPSVGTFFDGRQNLEIYSRCTPCPLYSTILGSIFIIRIINSFSHSLIALILQAAQLLFHDSYLQPLSHSLPSLPLLRDRKPTLRITSRVHC